MQEHFIHQWASLSPVLRKILTWVWACRALQVLWVYEETRLLHQITKIFSVPLTLIFAFLPWKLMVSHSQGFCCLLCIEHQAQHIFTLVNVSHTSSPLLLVCCHRAQWCPHYFLIKKIKHNTYLPWWMFPTLRLHCCLFVVIMHNDVHTIS